MILPQQWLPVWQVEEEDGGRQASLPTWWLIFLNSYNIPFSFGNGLVQQLIFLKVLSVAGVDDAPSSGGSSSKRRKRKPAASMLTSCRESRLVAGLTRIPESGSTSRSTGFGGGFDRFATGCSSASSSESSSAASSVRSGTGTLSS